MLSTVLSYIWPTVVGIMLGWVIVSSSFYRHFLPKSTFVSPLASTQILGSQVQTATPSLMGFLPYWNISKIDIQAVAVDQIAYFGLTMQADGTILTKQDGNLEPGYYVLQKPSTTTLFNTLKQRNIALVMVFSIFNNEILDTLIRSPQAQAQAIQTILATIKQYDLVGVNIDFEYNTTRPIAAGGSALLTQFMGNLSQAINAQYPEVIVTMDLFANAFIEPRYYDVKGLSQVVDQLVLMGYDFHRATSDKAGSVAPIHSQSGASIYKALQSATAQEIPSSKIILAMPLYGYEWKTTTKEFGSSTYPASGVIASYDRVHQLIQTKNLQVEWDFIGLTPWLTYEERGEIKQIYYDDDRSLKVKLDLITQAHLGGGAFWALGYDGKQASLWEIVKEWKQH